MRFSSFVFQTLIQTIVVIPSIISFFLSSPNCDSKISSACCSLDTFDPQVGASYFSWGSTGTFNSPTCPKFSDCCAQKIRPLVGSLNQLIFFTEYETPLTLAPALTSSLKATEYRYTRFTVYKDFLKTEQLSLLRVDAPAPNLTLEVLGVRKATEVCSKVAELASIFSFKAFCSRLTTEFFTTISF